MSENKIPLYVKDGVAYVWNAKDWNTIRVNYRICGALFGTIASFPRQNDFKGLPMMLLSVEAALLVEKGFCELFELSKLNEDLSEEQKQQIKEADEKVLDEQAEAFKMRKISQLSQKIDVIVAGKKKKMLSKGIVDVNIDKEALLQEEINKIPKLAPIHTLVHLPTEHSLDIEPTPLQVNVLKPCILSGEGAIQYSIFKDLWEKGYHITNGSKFGADFLIYPGDPVKFHSMYMLRCVNNTTEGFRPPSLVAFGRLSVSVNKLAVFGFCNAQGKVEYQTLQWHNSLYG
ncbi:tRNA-splicing endonuclease subunit Sen34 [Melitaea cinxia]|uniref:tRNA-splicing endonuclease subunit Sen34 n=1 Tax=Melitaea cinxia TaxID=113334 RepID=UPI001E26F7D9|nr:tRNA-splicing endonuclease subunit Sen34 [Melitaea cinxia]